MNVDVLQMHLTKLSELVRGAGAKGTANELDELCQLLQPYRDKKLKDLIATIAKAEEIVRNGPPTAKPRAPKKPKADLGPISERILDLYQRANDATMTRNEIIVAFGELEAFGPTLAQMEAIASRIGITEKFKKKPDLLNKMRKIVLDRKDVAERVYA